MNTLSRLLIIVIGGVIALMVLSMLAITMMARSMTKHVSFDAKVASPEPYHKHRGVYKFTLAGPANQFNRYPHNGWVTSHTRHLDVSGVECCCNVVTSVDLFVVCAQGQGAASDLGLEVLMQVGKEGLPYLLVRHQSDQMNGSRCRASWH